MKFRFCGDADCPDWLLLQIHTLSSLSSDKLEKLCGRAVQSFFNENELNESEVEDITRATILDQNDVKACLSAVRQILYNSSCNNVTREELTAELEQLGLEYAQSCVIGSAFQQHRDRLSEQLRESIRLARLKNIQVEKVNNENCVLVKMSILNGATDKLEEKMLTISSKQLSLLLADLKKIKVRMEELQTQTD